MQRRADLDRHGAIGVRCELLGGCDMGLMLDWSEISAEYFVVMIIGATLGRRADA